MSAGLLAAPTLSGKKRGYRALAISPDGEWIVGASVVGKVDVWRMPKVKEGHSGPLPQGEGPFRAFRTKGDKPLTDIGFSPDGRRVAAACADGGVYVWEMPREPGGRQVETIAPAAIWYGHIAAPRTLSWSRDGKQVVTVGEDDRLVVFDSRTGNQTTGSGPSGGSEAAAMHPLERHLASGHDDDGVRLWDVSLEPPRVVAEMQVHDGWWKRFVNRVTALAWHPDGKTLVVGTSRDPNVHLLLYPGLQRMLSFDPVKEAIGALAFGPDGKLAVGGRGGALAVVDLQARQVIAAARTRKAITGLAWHGRWIVAANGSNALHPLWLS